MGRKKVLGGMEALNTPIPCDDWMRLDEYCRKHGATKVEIIRKLVRDWIDKLDEKSA